MYYRAIVWSISQAPSMVFGTQQNFSICTHFNKPDRVGLPPENCKNEQPDLGLSCQSASIGKGRKSLSTKRKLSLQVTSNPKQNNLFSIFHQKLQINFLFFSTPNYAFRNLYYRAKNIFFVISLIKIKKL